MTVYLWWFIVTPMEPIKFFVMGAFLWKGPIGLLKKADYFLLVAKFLRLLFLLRNHVENGLFPWRCRTHSGHLRGEVWVPLMTPLNVGRCATPISFTGDRCYDGDTGWHWCESLSFKNILGGLVLRGIGRQSKIWVQVVGPSGLNPAAELGSTPGERLCFGFVIGNLVISWYWVSFIIDLTESPFLAVGIPVAFNSLLLSSNNFLFIYIR